MNISILLPTRKRIPLLKKAVGSLINNAREPEKLQFLFGVDTDDEETFNFLKESKYPNQLALQFNPIGYQNLHKYNNTLAGYANGKWIMFFNDDALMCTKNWDEKIMDFEEEFCLLKFKEQTGHPYSIFPCFPQTWFYLLDHISLHGQNDAWLSEIAYLLNIMRDVDINVIHDRADITGNNNDDTFRARIYKEGNPKEPGDLHHEQMVKLRFRDALKISWYLGLINQKNTFLTDHLANKTDPFILLKEKFDIYKKEGGLGAGKQDARVTDQREIKVSYSNLPKDQG
jgi:hypothetical protein|tara:strand:- start:302 stop:1159 length:858 start_codon:yes stop_codon:yes gene_type:complete